MPYKDIEKQRAYQREWVAKRRQAWFQDKKCPCGSTERLELDHINPRDKEDHKIWSWSAERRNAELAKCQALCYYCHKKKTRKEGGRTYS